LTDVTTLRISVEDAEEYTQALGQVLAGGWRQRELAWRLGVPQVLGMSMEDWSEQRLGGYVRMAIPERREAVAELSAEGYSQREIAGIIGTAVGTVNADLSVQDRTEDPVVSPETVTTQGVEQQVSPTAVQDRTEDQNETVVTTEPEPLTPATPGWHQLGAHMLYCGDSTDDEFVAACVGAFAFADPPYNAGKAEWDQGFKWRHDYLAESADIVAVTPGIAALAGFLASTDMPYRWSMAAEITNGMTSGALRFGNWICVTLFAHGSIYRKSKDHLRIPAATGDDDGGSHASRKPLRLLTHLIELFTTKGDTVVDPFLGSGTTLIAADRTGRRCIGAEIDPMHCAEIIVRYGVVTP